MTGQDAVVYSPVFGPVYIGGLEAYAAAADLVVCMAGYNTSCEVLGARTPAVMVPRASQRDEQRIRAVRLAERGLVDMIEPNDPAEAMAKAAHRALERGRRTHDAGLALDGHLRVQSEVARVVLGAEHQPAQLRVRILHPRRGGLPGLFGGRAVLPRARQHRRLHPVYGVTLLKLGIYQPFPGAAA